MKRAEPSAFRRRIVAFRRRIVAFRRRCQCVPSPLLGRSIAALLRFRHRCPSLHHCVPSPHHCCIPSPHQCVPSPCQARQASKQRLPEENIALLGDAHAQVEVQGRTPLLRHDNAELEHCDWQTITVGFQGDHPMLTTAGKGE